jgi:hypothetical protein
MSLNMAFRQRGEDDRGGGQEEGGAAGSKKKVAIVFGYCGSKYQGMQM